MATVREHYDVTARAFNAQSGWHIKNDKTSEAVDILGKISYRQEENAKYWSFYIPPDADFSHITWLLREKDVVDCNLEISGIDQIIGPADRPERQSLSSFQFTKRVYLYIDDYVSDEGKNNLIELGKSLNYSLIVRDRHYVEECDKLSKPLAFISHDSRDKETFVREFATKLNSEIWPIWYDDFSLEVGASLRESIEKGLKESKKCIVILSPNYINNEGWGKAEFDSIITREIIKKDKVIIPIWHNVSREEVFEFCPHLPDTIALKSSEKMDELVKKLAAVIRKTD